MADIAFSDTWTNPQTLPPSKYLRFKLFYSKGSSFATDQISYPILSNPSYPNCNTYTRVHSIGDFNGDGRSDILIGSCSDRIFHTITFYRDVNNPLLETVLDAFNRKVGFRYEGATTGSVYTKGSGRSYPISNVQLPMFLVRSMTQPDGIGGTNTTVYHYTDAWLHRKGLGFLGFAKVKSTNAILGTSSESNFDIFTASTALTPYLKTSVSKVGISTTTTTIVPEFIHQGNNRWWFRTKNSSSTNSYTHSSSNETFTYDTNGNVTENSVSINGGLETAKTTNIYIQTNPWTPPTAISSTVEKTRAGQNAYTATTTRTFGTKGELLTEKSLNGTDYWVKTEILPSSYNSFGLPTMKTVSGGPAAGGVSNRVSSMIYTPNGRFISETTNPLGQKSSAIYDAKWGKPLATKSIGGLSSSSTYDGFGRLKTATSALGYVTEVKYEWSGNTNYLYKVTSTVPGRPTSVKYVDIFEREIKMESTGFHAATIVTKTTYDAQGRAYLSTAPHYSGGQGVETTTQYDVFNRVTQVSNGTGTTTFTYDYDSNGNLTKSVTDASGQVKSSITDAAGKVTSATDNGGTLFYDYDSFGNQKRVFQSVTNPFPVMMDISRMEYDDAGRQKSLFEPNSGISTYEYNAYGELKKQNIANVGETSFTYNDLGQVKIRSGVEGATNYTYYDDDTKADVNALKKVDATFSGNIMEYKYDAFGRAEEVKETIKAKIFITSTTYGAYNNVEKITYPSSFAIKRVYDGAGYLEEVTNETGAIKIFTGNEMDALGHYKSYTLGNGATSTMTYDDYGFPQNFTAKIGNNAPIQDYSFSFDVANGNLTSRADNVKGLNENFDYDNLERLTMVHGPVPPMMMNYASNGNINDKTELGNYSYDALKIHAVTKVASYPQGANSQSQTIKYNEFHQPKTISEFRKNGPFPWNATVDISYGADYERRYTTNEATEGDNARTVFYLGDYEEIYHKQDDKTAQLHYIYGGDGLCAIVVKNSCTDEEFEYHYVYKDHLGSILTTTNSTGAITGEQSFDTWGRRRNVDSWQYWNGNDPQENPLLKIPSWLFRGYTGHEHLDVVFGIELINMNARLYDPVLGRMLRWDTYAGDGSTQGFNRYSYAMNNPLKYTDPTGNWAHIAIGAVIGGFVNLALNAHKAETVGQFFGYFAVGALAGALTAAVGAGISSALASGGSFSAGFFGTAAAKTTTGFIAGAISGAGSGAAGGFVSGFGNSALQGNSIGQNLRSGFRDAGIGLLSGGIMGGLSEGIYAASHSRKFWSGDFKTFQGTEAIYAGLNGGSEIYSDLEDYTVFNGSQSDVYYKPEGDIYGLNNRIPSGKGIKEGVDGIATVRYSDKVYKVPGKYLDITRPKASVDIFGDVSLKFNPISGGTLGLKQTIDKTYRYGWLSRSQIDGKNWDFLFQMAIKIHP